jgi:hypothetical protein
MNGYRLKTTVSLYAIMNAHVKDDVTVHPFEGQKTKSHSVVALHRPVNLFVMVEKNGRYVSLHPFGLVICLPCIARGPDGCDAVVAGASFCSSLVLNQLITA